MQRWEAYGTPRVNDMFFLLGCTRRAMGRRAADCISSPPGLHCEFNASRRDMSLVLGCSRGSLNTASLGRESPAAALASPLALQKFNASQRDVFLVLG